MTRRPVWDTTGQPANLEACALDALEWLRLFRGWEGFLTGEDAARLDRAIEALTRLLAETR